MSDRRTLISAKELIDAILFAESGGKELLTIPDGIPPSEDIEAKLYLYRLASLSYAIIMAGRERESLLALQADLECRVSALPDEELGASDSRRA